MSSRSSSPSFVQTSVIIPTFNYGRFLRESLQSVFAQTLQNFEIIVVDDGSTDETPEILSSLSDPRLRSFRIPRSGIPAARNKGLQEASGEFVAYLDADDRWLPNKLERQVSVLSSEPSVGVVFSDLVRFNEEGFLSNQFLYFPKLPSVQTRLSGAGGGQVIVGDAFCELISFGEFPAYLSTMLFRRSFARGLEFPSSLTISEDLYFAMKLYGRAQVAYISDILVEVRRHKNNTATVGMERAGWDLKALAMLKKEESSLERKRAIRARIGKLHAGIGYHHYWHNRPLSSARAYLKCLAYPSHRLNALLHLLTLPYTPFLKFKPDGL